MFVEEGFEILVDFVKNRFEEILLPGPLRYLVA